MGIETVGTEVQLEVEDRTSVEVENGVSHLRLDPRLKAWPVRGFVDDNIGVSTGLTTMYVGIIVGEGVIVTS